jgi:hypothetical protein
VSVAIRSNFEITWFRIAVEHERDALAARRTAEQAAESDRGDAFDAELRGTMVAVAAAAFAVDALHLTINDLLEEGLRSSAGGDGRIVETLKIALELGPRTQDWQRRVPELFGRRGELVHFRGKDRPPLPHPTGLSHVSTESATFNADLARGSVDLALEVLTVAYTSVRPKHAGVLAWALQNAHVPEYLARVRRGESS